MNVNVSLTPRKLGGRAMAKEPKLPQFMPLLHCTMDTPAWKATSPHARCIYTSLKRRVPRGRNEAFLSYSDALDEVGGNRRAISRSFAELERYGFVVKVRGGCLGVNGEATIWRLTELGTTTKTSKTGVPEPPTRDYQRWDGTKFKPKLRKDADVKRLSQSPRGNRAGAHVGTRPSPHAGTRPVPTREPRSRSNGHAPGAHVGTTTSLTTTYEPEISPEMPSRSDTEPFNRPQGHHRGE